MSEFEPEERRQEVRAVLLKYLGFAAGTVAFIFIVTLIVVKSLNLNSSSDPVGGPGPVDPVSSLPSTALPAPQDSGTPDSGDTATPSDPTSSATPGSTDLFLSASPVFVKAMERINMTGQWPGKDNVSLLIQRFEDGEWVDFGVQVQVKVGTFETYVETGREGENKFRVYDPETSTSSNEVTVTIG